MFVTHRIPDEAYSGQDIRTTVRAQLQRLRNDLHHLSEEDKIHFLLLVSDDHVPIILEEVGPTEPLICPGADPGFFKRGGGIIIRSTSQKKGVQVGIQFWSQC